MAHILKGQGVVLFNACQNIQWRQTRAELKLFGVGRMLPAVISKQLINYDCQIKNRGYSEIVVSPLWSSTVLK